MNIETSQEHSTENSILAQFVALQQEFVKLKTNQEMRLTEIKQDYESQIQRLSKRVEILEKGQGGLSHHQHSNTTSHPNTSHLCPEDSSEVLRSDRTGMIDASFLGKRGRKEAELETGQNEAVDGLNALEWVHKRLKQHDEELEMHQQILNKYTRGIEYFTSYSLSCDMDSKNPLSFLDPTPGIDSSTISLKNFGSFLKTKKSFGMMLIEDGELRYSLSAVDRKFFCSNFIRYVDLILMGSSNDFNFCLSLTNFELSIFSKISKKSNFSIF